MYATKQLVAREEDEGYRIIIEEHRDPEMLQTLKEYHAKIPALRNCSSTFVSRARRSMFFQVTDADIVLFRVVRNPRIRVSPDARNDIRPGA